MLNSNEKIFITSALLYTNGPLHFGHLAGAYIPADIYHRFNILKGNDVIHISGSDEHGVAITLNAEKEGTRYQEYVDRYNKEHIEEFKKYNIQFSHYGRTSAKYHIEPSQLFFTELLRKGHIQKDFETQPYCLDCEKYLPDRYLGGTCKHCKHDNARGDECPSCGRWLSLDDLTEIKCKICANKNVEIREESQFFLMLNHFEEPLKKWISNQTNWKSNVKNYALSLIEKGLPKRAITRNLDWGIDVPNEPGKKLYVWFDAPIGYLSNLHEYNCQRNEPRDAYFDKNTSMIHFIGKDNIVFHTIVWPAMLLGMGYHLPTNVPANMYLQIEGKKLSKSDGCYIDASNFIEKFGVDRTRFYLSRVIPETNDTNFSIAEFQNRVNAELVNNLANLFNRTVSMIGKYHDHVFDALNISDDHITKYLGAYVNHMQNFQFNLALDQVLKIGDHVNTTIQNAAPWAAHKEGRDHDVKDILNFAGNGSLIVAALLWPFTPNYSKKVALKFGMLPNDLLVSFQNGFNFQRINTSFKINSETSIKIPKIMDEDVTFLQTEMGLKS